MTKPLAVFRADAGPKLGNGHIVRCITLAYSLKNKGWNCIFAVNEDAVGLVLGIAAGAFPVIAVQSTLNPASDARQLRSKLDTDCHLLVVDHYNYDKNFETICRSWSNQVLILDDLANRHHDCDFLLDQTFGRQVDEYKSLVPDDSRVLAGSNYALVRPEFRQLRAESLSRRQSGEKLRRVLVTMGGTDPFNITSIVLRGMAGYAERLGIWAILGTGSPHIEDIKYLADNLGFTLEREIGAADMATQMLQADFCFGTAGSTAWERCCLGLPSAIVVVAQNQMRIADELAASGAAINLGARSQLGPYSISRTLDCLIKAPKRLHEMSLHAASICDGQGSDRVAEAITA